MDIYLADPPDYLDQRLLVINAVRLVHVEFCLLGIAAVELMSGLNRGSIVPDKPESIGTHLFYQERQGVLLFIEKHWLAIRKLGSSQRRFDVLCTFKNTYT